MYNKTEFSVVTSALFWRGLKRASHVGKAALSYTQITVLWIKIIPKHNKLLKLCFFLKTLNITLSGEVLKVMAEKTSFGCFTLILTHFN